MSPSRACNQLHSSIIMRGGYTCSAGSVVISKAGSGGGISRGPM